ncbi:hypothetical protein ABW21_db0205311 [Orbilia brochopaga]|nr:hypothetical protein ABW21_db0205311 [Drechslerella brochopaga]
MATATRTVSPLVIQYDTVIILERAGLLSSPIDNKRKLSTSTIASSSSGTPSTSSSKPGNLDPANLTDPTTTIEIPTHLESKETLECIGFSPDRAAQLWELFSNPQIVDDDDDDDVDNCLYTFILETLRYSTCDAIDVYDDWRGALLGLGIGDWLSEAIMAEEFKDIRHTASCKHWVTEAIMENFEVLRDLDDKLRAKIEAGEVAQDSEKKVPRRGSVTLRPQVPHITKRPSTADATTLSKASQLEQAPSALPDTTGGSIGTSGLVESGTVEQGGSAGTGAANVGGGGKQSGTPMALHTGAGTTGSGTGTTGAADGGPRPDIQSSAVGPTADDCPTLLWRGTTETKTRLFYNRETGKVNALAFWSAPGDLSPGPLAYWTPQKETAQRYARWLVHKMPMSEIVLVNVVIDKRLTKNLNPAYLMAFTDTGLNPEFQEFVWNCRRGQRIPDHLYQYATKGILIANIASGLHEKYHDMRTWKLLKASDVLKVKIDGEERLALQWVFQDSAAIKAFQDHCEGKVRVYRYNQPQELRNDMC